MAYMWFKQLYKVYKLAQLQAGSFEATNEHVPYPDFFLLAQLLRCACMDPGKISLPASFNTNN